MEKNMADFVAKSTVKSSVRKLVAPLEKHDGVSESHH